MTIYRIEIKIPCIEVHYVEISDEDAALISEDSALSEIPDRFGLNTDLQQHLPAELLSVEVVSPDDYVARFKDDYKEIHDREYYHQPSPPTICKMKE